MSNHSIGRRLARAAGVSGATRIGPVLDIARPLAPGVRWTATTTRGTHLILTDQATAYTVAAALRAAGYNAFTEDVYVLLDT